VHRPDPLTPIEETLRALDDLVRAGKVRYIGHSNFTPAQTIEAQWAARHFNLNSFVSAQDEYSLLKRDIDGETLGVYERYGLGLLPFYPLASGLLTGKHKRGAPAAGSRLAMPMFAPFMNDKNFDAVEKLDAFVKARGHSMTELAFSWLAARPCVASVIAGATKPEQIEANVKAADWALSADDLAEIDKLTAK
jgi:aryl-alcohol dehydrogenase-like predicted oxidoreductase